MKLSSKVVRQVSASLIGQSKLYIIDTEGGNRLTQFCAISSTGPINKSECLNLYNLETHKSRPSIRNNERTGQLRYGNWLPFRQMLTTINEYFRRSNQCSILVGHSAISADSSHLTSNLLLDYQQRRQSNQANTLGHSRIVGYIDTLPLFKRLYPHLQSYKQIDLVRYFLGVPYNAHNALDDSLMLFSLWNKYLWPLTKNNPQVLSQASVSNLYCVDRYLAKSRFSFKSYLENVHCKGLAKSIPRRQRSKVTLFRTKLLLGHLYPMLNKGL